jgi:hypothetical protein
VSADAGWRFGCFSVAIGPARLHSAFGHMKPIRSFVPGVLLLLAGCGASQDELSLRPYTSIPTGTVVVVQMRAQGPWEVIMTNEYILEGFEEGFVNLRSTNGLRLGYAGRMIKSIEPKAARKP